MTTSQRIRLIVLERTFAVVCDGRHLDDVYFTLEDAARAITLYTIDCANVITEDWALLELQAQATAYAA